MSMEQRSVILAEIVQLEEHWHQAQDPRAVLACFDICAANGIPLPNWAQPTIRKAIAPAKNEFGYGGFEVDSESETDPGWTKLQTIGEYLQDGEVLPPYLARWLGEAIERSGGDPNELMRRLELKKGRGRPRTKFTDKDELFYGAKLYELEGKGLSAEAALAYIDEQHDDNSPCRSLLQKWRNIHRKAIKES